MVAGLTVRQFGDSEDTVRCSLLSFVATPLACLAFAACARTAPPSAPPLPRVNTVTARPGILHPTLRLAGVVVPYRQLGIAANLSEPIREVDVQEGDRVQAGQVLARLLTDDLEAQLSSAHRIAAEDEARYAQTLYQVQAVNAQDASAINAARAGVRQAQMTLAGAQADLRRYESLFSQGYLPEQTYAQQQLAVRNDQQALDSALASLNQALANAHANGSGSTAGVQQQNLAAARASADAALSSVEQLRRQLARATIVAPATGIVDAVNANPGEYPSGRQLFTIEQIENVYAVLPSSTAQVVQLKPGAAATIVASGSQRRDRGTIAAILDQVQPGTTNFTVKVLVSNADEHLHAGMPVTGNVDEPEVRGIVIPVSAFVDDTHQSVYVVSDGVVHVQKVTEIKGDGTNAVVSGIVAGTVVVKDVGATTVGNGDRVQVQIAGKTAG